MGNKKIGIVTFFKSNNYGAVLQAFALTKHLTNNDYEAEIVNYWPKDMKKEEKVLDIILKTKNIKEMIIKLLKKVVFFRIDFTRKMRFNNFIKNKITKSKKLFNIEELKEYSKDYNCLITGSDQVWNKDITKENSYIYLLNFCNNKQTKKNSYSASIGKDNIIEEEEKEIANSLKEYNNISVRENSAKKILENVGFKNVEVTLDPSFLLSKEEWEEVCKDEKKPKEKYILLYMLERNKKLIESVNYVSNKLGLKIIHFNRTKTVENLYKSKYIASPKEFISLFKNAEFVLTNSFHGTAFSIIFNKQFISIPHTSRNTRQKDLLKMLEIEDRLLIEDKNIEELLNKKIDYGQVNKILEEKIKKSKEFLKNSIEG